MRSGVGICPRCLPGLGAAQNSTKRVFGCGACARACPLSNVGVLGLPSAAEQGTAATLLAVLICQL